MKLVHETGVEFGFSAYAKAVCRVGQGHKCCRYVIGDLGGGDGLHCAKLNPSLVEQIFIRQLAGSMVARGDNCKGKPQEEVL